MTLETVACIGVGNIGRAWAIAFARGGKSVRLFDASSEVLEGALDIIQTNAADLETASMIDSANQLMARITVSSSLEDAVNGAGYVQESIKEDIALKTMIFAELDAAAGSDTILASSSSEFMSSQFISEAQNPERCLVAHPFNPPSVIPLVEICGHPGTDPAVIQKTRDLFENIEMSPVVINKEIKAFLLNRLQAAVVGEALYLVGAGYCSASDLDRAMTDGLGLRWAFMGPFRTGHLNASGGYAEYMRTYGDTFRRMIDDLQLDQGFDLELIDQVAAEMEETVPADEVPMAQRWRDQRLMELIKHRRSSGEYGE